MNTNNQKSIPKFLKSGGEMAQIITEKDWRTHSLGIPENWPVALKLGLSNILNRYF